jgi:ABC-2 type transport system permease protein
MRAYLSLLAMELKKTVSYRVDFWVSMAVSLVAELVVQWAWWTAVYAAAGATTLKGWSLYGIILYGVVVFFVRRIVTSRQFGVMSEDIYTGSLSRYLVQPVDFITARYVGQVAYSTTLLLQFALGVAAFALLLPWPDDVRLSWLSAGQGLVSLLLAHALHFLILAVIDMAAFWIDTTWTLVVMWRWVAALFGGAMFPLALFPEWAQGILRFTPFPYLYAWPLESFMGRVAPFVWLQGIGVTLVWGGLMALLVRWVYQKGLRGYAGVGI